MGPVELGEIAERGPGRLVTVSQQAHLALWSSTISARGTTASAYCPPCPDRAQGPREQRTRDAVVDRGAAPGIRDQAGIRCGCRAQSGRQRGGLPPILRRVIGDGPHHEDRQNNDEDHEREEGRSPTPQRYLPERPWRTARRLSTLSRAERPLERRVSRLDTAAASFARDVLQLYGSDSTTEESYYPALRDFWQRLLDGRGVPFQVRAGTSERRVELGGADRPDLALYDRGGFVAVFAEVKPPTADLRALAASTERNDQIGRYLAQTGVALVTNVRSVGLVACKPGFQRGGGQPVPPGARELLDTISLWPSAAALQKGAAIRAVARQANLREGPEWAGALRVLTIPNLC